MPENVNIGRSVINITANDPDEGLGGEIKYEFIDEGEANGKHRYDNWSEHIDNFIIYYVGLFQINPLTGEIRTKKVLSGKGRPDPYTLRLRGTDGGGLHGDTELSLYIGDVSANDGVPLFIKPTLDQVASISEVKQKQWSSIK